MADLTKNILANAYYVGSPTNQVLGLLVTDVTMPTANVLRLSRVDGTFTDMPVGFVVPPGPPGPPGEVSAPPPPPPPAPPPAYTRPAVDMLVSGYGGALYSNGGPSGFNVFFGIIQNTLGHSITNVTVNAPAGPFLSRNKDNATDTPPNMPRIASNPVTLASSMDAEDVVVSPGVLYQGNVTSQNYLDANTSGISYHDGMDITLDPTTRYINVPVFLSTALLPNEDRALTISIAPAITSQLNWDGTKALGNQSGGTTDYIVNIGVYTTVYVPSSTPVTPPVSIGGSITVVGQGFFRESVQTIDLTGLTAPCSFTVSFHAAPGCKNFFLTSAVQADLAGTVALDPYGVNGVIHSNSNYYNVRHNVLALLQATVPSVTGALINSDLQWCPTYWLLP